MDGTCPGSGTCPSSSSAAGPLSRRARGHSTSVCACATRECPTPSSAISCRRSVHGPTTARSTSSRTTPRSSGCVGCCVSRETVVSIALVYPELLGTYGDRGNALVLARRLAWRGIANEVVEVAAGAPVPSGCDLYVVGGGEDDPQVTAADHLRADGGLSRAVERGATLLAVCAGYQIVGTSFEAASGVPHPGLALL